MTKTQAKAWLRIFGDTPDELRMRCKRGHSECSVTLGGECLDEVIHAACIDTEATESP